MANLVGVFGGATLGGCVMLASAVASAATIEIGPEDDLGAALGMLAPGDELVLRGGTYTLTARLGLDLVGTQAQRITVRAAEGEVPHITRPDASQNLVDFDNVHFVTIEGIEFSGGSAGLRMSDVSDLTLRGNHIHDTGDVAIRANDTGIDYRNLHIVENHVHHTNDTGEGMYLGCNNDGCRLLDSIIERNYVHHTNQASVVQGDGIEIKEGSAGNIIRDNVIHDTGYPCILTYSTNGNGAANVIEGNVMWNCGDHGIQSAADTIIRNNIILSTNADGIAMQPHQSGAPANLVVMHNTVLQPGGDALSLRGAVGSVVIANNAFYAQGGSAINFPGGQDLSAVVVAGNVGAGGLAGFDGGFTAGDMAADLVDGNFAGGPPIDVFPAEGGGLVGAGDAAYTTEVDFNLIVRSDPPDVGAYTFDANGNPGWAIAAEFKEFPDGVGETSATGSGSATDSDASSGGSASDSAGPDSATATGGLTTSDGGTQGSAAGSGDTSDGCGCRQGPGRSGSVLFALVALIGLKRRRLTTAP